MRYPSRSILAITASHISIDMQTGSLAILLPFLLKNLHLNYALAAAIVMSNQIIIAIAQPVFGTIGDKKSFRWMLWAGTLLTGLAMTLVMWMPNYNLVIFAVLLSGLGSAMFHPEALTRIRSLAEGKPASATSFFFSGGNIGFALGPIVATLLYTSFGKVGVLAMLIPTALALFFLWKNRSEIFSGFVHGGPKSSAGNIPILWGVVSFLILLIVLRGTVVGGLQTFIPLYFHDLGLPSTHAAFLVTVLAIFGAVGTLSGGYFAEKYGRRNTMAITALLALIFLAVFLRSSGVIQLISVGFAGACLSAAWPLIVIMIQEAMPSNIGLASGLSLGTAYGATGIGVALLGQVADKINLAAVMNIITLMPIGIFLLTLFVKEKYTQASKFEPATQP